MNIHADKREDNRSRSVTDAVPSKEINSESTFQFVDNRYEAAVQRKRQEHIDNVLKAKKSAQLQAMTNSYSDQQQQPIQKKENKTGLPDNLKSGIENLSGYSMDDVKVYYNSDKPAQLQAHAYAQGTNIHLASGQEKHLPHEAWHVVQQKQGRVKPTLNMKGGVNINDDGGLEKEADTMGAKAMQANKPKVQTTNLPHKNDTIQRTVDSDLSETEQHLSNTKGYQEYVLEKVRNYGQNSRYTDENIDSELANRMSNGLKIWSQNYYNKTQAYLFEGQKANDFTNPDSTFAILGHDTNLDPDIEIHERRIGYDRNINWSGGIAHELKASTSADYSAVYNLVKAGIKQLKKREDSGNQYGDGFTRLLLTVHNDDPKNTYPFTDHMFSTNYNNDFNNIPTLSWDNRLQTLLAQAVANEGIKTPLEVRMEFNGRRYATAIFNT